MCFFDGRQDTEGSSRNIVSLIQKEYIGGCFHEAAVTEEHHIRSCLYEMLKDISLSECQPLVKFTPILTGSSAERSKTGYPDEYDFLLVIQNVLDECSFSNINSTTSVDVEFKEGGRCIIEKVGSIL